MWIVDDEFDASLPLPRGERDIPLMIADRTFDRHNQLTDPFTAACGRPPTASSASRVLVNGAYLPHHRVAAAPLPAADPQRVPLPHLQPAPLQRAPMIQIGDRQRPDAGARSAAARS